MVPDQPDRYTLFSRVPSLSFHSSLATLCPYSLPFVRVSLGFALVLANFASPSKTRDAVDSDASSFSLEENVRSRAPKGETRRKTLVQINRRLSASAYTYLTRAEARARNARESDDPQASGTPLLFARFCLSLSFPLSLSLFLIFSPRSFYHDGERRQEESSGCSFLTSPYNATRESIRAPASSLFLSLSLSSLPSSFSFSLFLTQSLYLALSRSRTNHPSCSVFCPRPSVHSLSLFVPLALSLCRPPFGWGDPSPSIHPVRDASLSPSHPCARAHPSYTPLHPRYLGTLGRCTVCPSLSLSHPSPRVRASNGAAPPRGGSVKRMNERAPRR
ncbi:hypothetical protein DMN91_009513 [Ooceraea biroi]|uniref:Uncharacterized protein n=1 Tax=Ooceraea biroi TaxID=2015173 RepID=A0A3L8DFC0_OOCBI|nr:uncharacterized protein LOC105287049 [Ooceraea biroi]XP_011350739.1 uncharacterized protein LOC105287049 [Ooceraea biroi]XP_011350740.1 uncharacterized protein LOC105287049 [Ooceraea biroi]XP_011350741.1 uncharacterized protein LOC105287049 [Ooceraea biroi]XP_011350742.1 uncharacterized protein LOC105287049 [Ooceraea biroi]RLU19155.1 hypothetical protein DMN91_009513 [Ooceraea biroi]